MKCMWIIFQKRSTCIRVENIYNMMLYGGIHEENQHIPRIVTLLSYIKILFDYIRCSVYYHFPISISH